MKWTYRIRLAKQINQHYTTNAMANNGNFPADYVEFPGRLKKDMVHMNTQPPKQGGKGSRIQANAIT